MKTKTDTFQVSSGSLVVGDPCYDTNLTLPAENGLWTANVVMCDAGNFWGRRVRKAIVHHVEFNPAARGISVEEKNFSVDSGQAGVFDGGSYGADGFYDLCCRRTLSKSQWGYLRDGFVTSSGYGDGWYSAEVHKVGGKAVCVEITFIGEEE